MSSSFSWSLFHYHEPKLGHSDSEYEDAWDFSPQSQQQGVRLRIAVADGATGSSFSGLWAGLLSGSYSERRFRTPYGLKRATRDAAAIWHRQVFSSPLPWYAEEKARKGAFSSLLGLDLTATSPECNVDGQTGEWCALAVGDTCMFHIRRDQLLVSFPLIRPDDFSNTPLLISSNLSRNAEVWTNVEELQGQWQIGDLFILATDAMAAWLLSEVQQGRCPWLDLLAFEKQEERDNAFRAWADSKRENKGIKNDDLTCILIKV